MKLRISNNEKEKDLTALLFKKLMDTESPEVIKALLEKGADVNAKIIIGLNTHTPLTIAIASYFNTDVDTIKLLIDFGADINAKNVYGSTPLIFAAVQCKLEAIKILVELGADINAKNNIGNTPLICATISKASLETIKCVTMAKALIEIIKELVELGADANVKNNEGKTALDYAKDSTTKEILKKAMDKE